MERVAVRRALDRPPADARHAPSGRRPPAGRESRRSSTTIATGPRVLMMKRVERIGNPWSGHISLPGGGYQADGRRSSRDRDPRDQEELGIDLAPARLIGPLPMLSPLSSGPNGVEVTPFVFVTEHLLATNPGPEAVSAFWLPLEARGIGQARRRVHVSRHRADVPELELRGPHDLGADVADPRRRARARPRTAP